MLAFLFYTLLSCAARVKDTTTVSADTASIWESCSNTIGSKACPLSLLDQNGDTFNLYDSTKDKSLVFDVSATWCYWCQKAAETVPEVQAKYKEQLVYVTVLVDYATQEDAKHWADTFGITSPVLQGSESLMNDTPQNSWSIEGFPTFFFLDANKNVVSSQIGWSESGVEENIKLVLP